ncbi:transcription repressor NadR [Streptococcus sp. X16XC17]|uniref:transcription repressor NadR n=1 Tax=unclassified Streptococcus TaxID=2608887 RepID=UPI00066FDE29|nr:MULTISPECIES: transcription repressor NadR [unclassified Streptococcus]TCD46607.1 transcription repressor NadR [Streptococcus sp. X16XC17]
MKAIERRQQIIEYLTKASHPMSASYLAKQLSVSRQIIVGDIALLRAENHEILSTHRGYLLSSPHHAHAFLGKIVCCHKSQDTEKEMLLIVNQGGIILDVQVEHPIYGMLTAALNIQTSEDVHNFIKQVRNANATLLSSLTQGIHIHTIACTSKDEFEQIKKSLSAAKLLWSED